MVLAVGRSVKGSSQGHPLFLVYMEPAEAVDKGHLGDLDVYVAMGGDIAREGIIFHDGVQRP